MSDAVISATVAAISAFIISLVSALISFRVLRSEYQNKFRLELINRQINACEKLWLALALASKSRGIDHVIQYHDSKVFLNTKAVAELHKNILDALNSSSGLYYSKILRNSVFELRNFLEAELELDTNEKEIPISKSKAKNLDGYVQNVRIAIRKELNLEDLRITKEGPV